jgi:2-polyprenyl-6-methoxyphenol hydroxylase-like FAD-dependent oxidoreductase
MHQNPFRRAVVAGASMAGLLAARALSVHFDQVTIVERDELPRGPEARKGVPQGRHVHVLLLRGHSVLENLFPGITEELRAAGALTVNGGREIAWYHAGDWRTRYDSDLWLLALSRPLLESHVAARVLALPNVKLLESARIQGVQTESGSVTGVLVAEDGQNHAIAADLVVDATGRGSAAANWLTQLGCEPVPVDLIPAQVTYSTCAFTRPERGPDWQAMIVANPEAKRTGFAFAVESNRWLMTLASLLDEPYPEDHKAFLAFAKSLPVPDLYEALRDLQPHAAPVRYRFGGSQRRRFERLKSVPAGLIAVGDAVCSFNPVYGQGMTVAALEAELLGRILTEAKANQGLDAGFSRRWYQCISKIIDLAWQGVLIEDFRLPELADRRPASLRPLQWYMQRVHHATHRSAAVTDQFYRVISFLDPPAALFSPRIMANVLLGALRMRTAAESSVNQRQPLKAA